MVLDVVKNVWSVNAVICLVFKCHLMFRYLSVNGVFECFMCFR